MIAHSSESEMVAMPVTKRGTRCSGSDCQMCRMLATSIRPHATRNSNADTTASGSSVTNGDTNIRMINRKTAAKAADNGVFAPECTLTPERLNEPLDGYDEKKAPARLARPCPTIS